MVVTELCWVVFWFVDFVGDIGFIGVECCRCFVNNVGLLLVLGLGCYMLVERLWC